MWNGFYDMSIFKTTEDLQQFFREAIILADKVQIDYLDCKESWSRQPCDDFTPEEYINKFISLNTHNVCIDRIAYWEKSDVDGEIGSCTTVLSVNYYIFIYLNRDNFYSIVEKYELKPKLI